MREEEGIPWWGGHEEGQEGSDLRIFEDVPNLRTAGFEKGAAELPLSGSEPQKWGCEPQTHKQREVKTEPKKTSSIGISVAIPLPPSQTKQLKKWD